MQAVGDEIALPGTLAAIPRFLLTTFHYKLSILANLSYPLRHKFNPRRTCSRQADGILTILGDKNSNHD
jgi:hypothetical protein